MVHGWKRVAGALTSMSKIKARERTKGEGQSIASWVSLRNIPENATQWLLLTSFWPEMVSHAPLLFPNENIGFQLGTLLSQTKLRCSSKKEKENWHWATRNLGSNLWKKGRHSIFGKEQKSFCVLAIERVQWEKLPVCCVSQWSFIEKQESFPSAC